MQKKGRFATVRNLFSGEHTIKRAVDDITFSVDDGGDTKINDRRRKIKRSEALAVNIGNKNCG